MAYRVTMYHGEGVDWDIAHLQHEHMEELPVDWSHARNRSPIDPDISQAIRHTRIGWPEICPN